MALGLLVLVVFGSTLAGDFVYDDRFIIVGNPWIRDPGDWDLFFTQDSWAGAGERNWNYRPLPLVTFGLNYLVGGLDPFGYHLVNLVLHALSALLVLGLARRLGVGRRSAWLAAALFAVHPLVVEPVAEVVGRLDLMAGLFFLGGLLLHIEGRARREKSAEGGFWHLAGAVLCYAGGLLSKEHVILLPLAAAVYDLRRARPGKLRDYAVYVGYVLVGTAYLTWRWVVFQGVLLAGETSLINNPLSVASAPVRVVSALAVAGRYLGHVLWPAGLSPDYCYAEILPFESASEPLAVVTVIVAATLVVASAWMAVRSWQVAFALGLAAAAFLPVSNLLFPILTVMGDRLFYLPLAGLALLAGLTLDRLSMPNERIPLALAGVALVILSIAGFRQARHWRNDLALDTLAVRNAPLCTRAHSNLGHDLLELDDLDGAEARFRRSLEIHPGFLPAVGGQARVALQRGQYGKALRLAREVLVANPDARDVLELAGEAARRQGDLAAARYFWERRSELEPAHARTLSDLAVLLWGEGEIDRALSLWRRAAEQPGSPPEIWFNLARALDGSGRTAEAVVAYERFLASRSTNEEARTAARARLRQLGGR